MPDKCGKKLISFETGGNGVCRFLQTNGIQASRLNKNKYRRITGMRGLLKLFTVAGALLLAAAAHAQYANVTLSWTPSSSPDVAYYKVYYGTSSGNYESAVPVSASATSVTINGLFAGTTYYFAATSVDNSGNESAYSPEISGVAGASPASAAPMLTSTVASAAGQISFSVSGLSNATYVVQASTDLVNWVNIQTNVSPFNFVDSNASQFSRRFYRTAYTSD